METFSFEPKYTHKLTSQYNVLHTSFETGPKQRRFKKVKPRLWKLGFSAAATTIQSIVDFYDARYGSYGAFSWTPPGEETPITAIFQDDSLDFTFYGYDNGECELVIEEVL